jgi:chromosome segregation ATPase
VIKMREALREIDQDANGMMSLMEYLIYRYKETVDACVNSPQGDNQEEVARCQAELDKVATALAQVQKEQEAAAAALAQAQAAEAEVKAAEAELEAAIAELKAQEDAYAAKIAELEAKSQTGGVVSRNKAANELAQMKAEDPLPLRKAKITQEAALRRVQKARVAAEAATAEADAVKRTLDQKLEELGQAMIHAKEELQKAKAKGGTSHGNFWWMERELYEADKSLARAKQQYDHSKPLQYSE